MQANPLGAWACRAARENPETGQYELHSGSCQLALTTQTITLTAASSSAAPPPPPPAAAAEAPKTILLHMPLASLLFASASDKLMLVPSNRGPAWVIEMDQLAGGDALGCLRLAGVRVQGEPNLVPPPISEQEFEAIVASPAFNAFYESIEGTFARIRSRNYAESYGYEDFAA